MNLNHDEFSVLAAVIDLREVAFFENIDESGNGQLVAYSDVPEAVLDAVTAALTALRAGTLKPPVPVPASVWDWQFAGAAAAEGIITAQEALDWVGGGHVPASLVAAVDVAVTDPNQHAKVVLFLTGASQFPRAHPLVPVLGAAFGKDTPEKLDAFFVAAGAR